VARKAKPASVEDVVSVDESKLEAFAEDIGRLLGAARNRAEGWLSQRDTIIKDLTQLRDAADEYLSKLTGSREGRRSRAQEGGDSPAPRRSSQRRKRNLSDEARARIAAAQRKRWAKFRAGKKD
jgi:hypothetical protein